MKENINKVVKDLLENMDDPFPKYILNKEINKLDSADLLMDIKKSKWYKQLEIEQLEDGSYGRFHSMNPNLKKVKERRNFKTTEEALKRMSQLELSKDDILVQRSIGLMENYLKGIDEWEDRIEKHQDNGKSFCQARTFITAANLCRFDSKNVLLDEPRKICIEQLEKAFKEETFDEKAWRKANLDYSGTCLDAWMVYPLWLVQDSDYLSEELQRKYLQYIWNRKEGIYYISSSPLSQKVNVEDKDFNKWLNALEVVSGFTLFKELYGNDVSNHLLNEIKRLMNSDIVLPKAHPIFDHFSESWRNQDLRKKDLVLKIIKLLNKIN